MGEVMQLADFGALVASEGMVWHHLPVRDKWIPGDTWRFLTQGVAPLVQMLQDGRRVLVHCNGGKGRTGTLVAAALMTSSLGAPCLSEERYAEELLAAVVFVAHHGLSAHDVSVGHAD